jgi:hypothetical protein
MFRAPTTRKNVQYHVRESGQDSDVDIVCQVVQEKLEQYAAPGKIIAYSGKITQAENLGSFLGCPVYHRNGWPCWKGPTDEGVVKGRQPDDCCHLTH